MKRFVFFIISGLFALVISCGSGEKKAVQQKQETTVKISTEYGDIRLKLFDDTPEHKNNFIKLISEGFYNDLLFHRVMKNFMIQGGDPNSKNAQPGQRLGAGNPGYTVPAEFNSKYYHKKGALAAARQGGPTNPEKRSSGSQFYIVHGTVYTMGQLDTMEMMNNNKVKNEIARECFTAVQEELNKCRANNDQEGFNELVTSTRIEVDSIFDAKEKFVITEEQRTVYTTEGGYPSLDGEYTVFGEVIEGYDVLDKIAMVETDPANRPLSDVKMKIEIEK